MFELPIVARQARDLVESQFAAAEQPRGPARRRARRSGRSSAVAPLRAAGARGLRSVADRLEPRAEARLRSA